MQDFSKHKKPCLDERGFFASRKWHRTKTLRAIAKREMAHRNGA